VHDWLWRTVKALPERGRIGIFNRSHYEEVLAVRVNEPFLDAQRLPALSDGTDREALWSARYSSIRDHEQHLANNGTVVLKFWLDVSLAEQRKRFLERLQTPEKYWKFSKHDLSARDRWDDYMRSYELLLNETSQNNVISLCLTFTSCSVCCRCTASDGLCSCCRSVR